MLTAASLPILFRIHETAGGGEVGITGWGVFWLCAFLVMVSR